MNYGTAYDRWAGIGPYYAMFPRSFVDQVVGAYTQPGQSILDPFAGRASSIFAGAATGRPSIGIEISPVGWIYGQTKLKPASKTRLMTRLDEIGQLAAERSQPAHTGLPPFFRWCFAERSLQFLLAARSALNWRDHVVDRTLMTLILIDLHGVRSRSFSNQMRQSRAMEPNYSIRWWRARRMHPPRIDPVPFLQKKIEWRYARGVPEVAYGDVLLGDSSRVLGKVEARIRTGKLKPFSLLFTSPPYLGISDYHRDQWLRRWMLGGPPEYIRTGDPLRGEFESVTTYLSLLRSVFDQAADLMKRTGIVYVRTDARPATLEMTSQVLSECFPRWRKSVVQRPFSRQTQTALYGDKSRKPGEVDLILRKP